MWLTAVAFRFTRPTFHRGRSGYFTFVQREHMPACKITMHKSVVSLDAFNRPYDLAVRRRVFLLGGFAVGLALLQREYPTANYQPSPAPVSCIS